MILNKKVINYKVLDLVILYNFNIKFDFILDHMKKLWFFYVKSPSPDSKNIFLGMGDAITCPYNATISRGE
jgi:hypothetical protein